MQTLKGNAPRGSFKIVPSVYLLFCRDAKILLSKRASTGYEDGNYGLVAGHVESSESLRTAAAREASEEVGLSLESSAIELALVMHRFASTSVPPERMDFFMRINDWDGEPINNERKKCSELKWFDMTDLPSNTIPYIRYGVDKILAGTNYCEFGWIE